MDNLIGKSLGRYHILEQLGEGGMAIVYKAYDTRLERDVAIKVIRRGAFPPDQLDHILKRFEREAKALAKLSHTNIVRVLDYGDYDGAPYLVMEYLPGGTLKHQLGKPMPWQKAWRILLPISQALEYAHEHKVIHRDIKPSNILLTEKGQPMLTDFGIAKILEVQETATLTGSGMVVGTPEYMAPEQWTGQTTQQSDIYSLAVVLYEMVTGRKPYIADTPAAIFLKQVTDPLPRPKQYVRNLPDEVEKILLKALSKEASDRYRDMPALISALERLLAGRAPVPAGRGQTDETVDEWETETRTAQLEQTPTGASVMPARSNALISGGIWVLVALCIVLGAVSLVGYAVIKAFTTDPNPTSLPATEPNPTSPPSTEPNTIVPPATDLPTDTSEPTNTPLLPTNTVIVNTIPPPATNPPPTDSPPLMPYFTASENINCRNYPTTLPNLSKDDTDTLTLFKADTVPVLGKWFKDANWLLVDVEKYPRKPQPTSTECCWVYGENGTLTVPDQIKIISEWYESKSVNKPNRADCSVLK
jgi:serine/threonine protein kinase